MEAKTIAREGLVDIKPSSLHLVLLFRKGIINLLLIETNYGLIIDDDYRNSPLVR
jgi:hypothetical protein